jgi:hypothetical protein
MGVYIIPPLPSRVQGTIMGGARTPAATLVVSLATAEACFSGSWSYRLRLITSLLAGMAT